MGVFFLIVLVVILDWIIWLVILISKLSGREFYIEVCYDI